MIKYILVFFSLITYFNLESQALPLDITIGNIKSIRDSVSRISRGEIKNYSHSLKNEYHHSVSYSRTDSLFTRQWLLSATSSVRNTSITFSRDNSIIHREWYDHVLEYKFKEDFVYYEKDKIQFYEVKNVPFKYSQTDETNEIKYGLRFSNDYNRKAYFEYNDSKNITFEMNQDDFFQMKKFYHEYDLNGLPSLSKHFKNGEWLWSENHEYSNLNNTRHTFLFPRGKRFPFLIENELKLPESNIIEIEYSVIPETSLYKRPRSKKILYTDKDQQTAGNEYWFNLPISSLDFKFKKTLSNKTEFRDYTSIKTTSLEKKRLFTETVIKDELNRIIEYTIKSLIYDAILEKYNFRYNDHNHIIEVKSFTYELSNQLTTESLINFEYTYDSTGNWTKQVKSVNEKPVFEWNRYIEYYDNLKISR